MADAILYCDQCGRMVQSAEISNGQAIITPRAALCATCADALTPEQRQALYRISGQQPAVGPSPRPRRKTSRTVAAGGPSRTTPAPRRPTGAVPPPLGPVDFPEDLPEPEEPRSRKYVWVGLAALVFGGVLALVMLPGKEPGKEGAGAKKGAGKKDKRASGGAPAAGPDAGGGEKAGRKPSPDDPARRARLDRIRSLVDRDKSYSQYRKMQREFDSFLAEYPGDGELLELRKEVEGGYARLADEELKRAGKLARRLAESGFRAQAVSKLRSVAERFKDSAWYRERGAEAIRKALNDMGALSVALPGAEGAGGTGGRRGSRTTASGKNAVTNSGFEILGPNGMPVDWSLPRRAQLRSEKGNHFVRVEELTSGRRRTFFTGRFRLDPKWREVHVSCRVRAMRLRTGMRAVDKAMCLVAFENAKRKQIKADPENSPSLKKPSDWVQLDAKTSVPKGAAYVVLKPGLYSSLGTLDFDDITVGPEEAPRLEGRVTPEEDKPKTAWDALAPGAGRKEKPSGEADIGRARGALARGDLAGAREALSRRARWREADLRRAKDLLKKIAEAERAAAEAERLRKDPYIKLLLDMRQAARGGIAEAEACFWRGRKAVPRERSERLAHLRKRIGEAELVESVIVDGLAGLKRTVRLEDKSGRKVAGRVQGVEDGVITIKTSVGKLKEVRLADVPPRGLVAAARLLRHEAVSKLQLASFAYVLGDMDATADWLAEAEGDGVKALYDDIELVKAALPQAAVAGAEGGPAREATGAGDASAAGATVGIASEGLIGYWKLDDAGDFAADSSGNGNHGTRHGGSWTTGRIGGAFNCAGGAWIEMPSSPELDKVQEGDYSISCWYRPVEYHPAGLGSIFGKSGRHMGITSRAEAWLSIWHWFGGGEGEPFVSTDDRKKKATGTWYHVVGAVDQRAAKSYLYVDGRLGATDSWEKGRPTSPYGNATWKIGRANPEGGVAPQPAGNCDVDEARIYSRVLGKSEIAWLAAPGVSVATGAPGGGAVDAGLLRRMDAFFAKVPKDALGDIHLTRGVVLNLAGRYDEAKVTPKKLAAIGGAVAGSSLFNGPLRKLLKADQGYRFAPASGVAGGGKTVGSVLRGLVRYLERERPEFVRVCFDATDLARGRSAEDLKPHLAEAVDAILEGGAIPVLFTLPMSLPAEEEARKAVKEYNEMVVALAGELSVPCVDVWLLLNRDPTAKHTHFGARGALARGGFERMGKSVFHLYRILENLVAGRDVPIPLAYATPDGFRTGRAGEGKGEEEPPPPAGNVFTNAGFEQVERDKPKGWRKHNWGTGGQAIVRSDRMESRSGKRSLQIRSVGEGARGGALTVVTLVRGTYEVRFWATADVDATVSLHLRHGETELPAMAISGDWKQYKKQVNIYKTEKGTSFGFCLATPNGRVWLDDVELVFVER